MQLRISLTVSQILVESTEAWKGKNHFGRALLLLALPKIHLCYVFCTVLLHKWFSKSHWIVTQIWVQIFTKIALGSYILFDSWQLICEYLWQYSQQRELWDFKLLKLYQIYVLTKVLLRVTSLLCSCYISTYITTCVYTLYIQVIILCVTARIIYQFKLFNAS